MQSHTSGWGGVLVGLGKHSGPQKPNGTEEPCGSVIPTPGEIGQGRQKVRCGPPDCDNQVEDGFQLLQAKRFREKEKYFADAVQV